VIGRPSSANRTPTWDRTISALRWRHCSFPDPLHTQTVPVGQLRPIQRISHGLRCAGRGGDDRSGHPHAPPAPLGAAGRKISDLVGVRPAGERYLGPSSPQWEALSTGRSAATLFLGHPSPRTQPRFRTPNIFGIKRRRLHLRQRGGKTRHPSHLNLHELRDGARRHLACRCLGGVGGDR